MDLFLLVMIGFLVFGIIFVGNWCSAITETLKHMNERCAVLEARQELLITERRHLFYSWQSAMQIFDLHEIRYHGKEKAHRYHEMTQEELIEAVPGLREKVEKVFGTKAE